MPYIPEYNRERYDFIIQELVDILAAEEWLEGDVNYVLSRIMNAWFADITRYSTIKDILGTLEAVKLEFYRRKGAPYENKAIEKNGDI